MTDTVIVFEQVSKAFGRQIAIQDVSLQVPRGVVFALLGENGAGKTTAIRTMLGLEVPDRGRVSILGLDGARDGFRIRQRIGYVPERPVLYEWMTATEAGWFAAGFFPAGYETRFADLVGQFKLPLDRPIKKLSKGMRAKLALSLAMASQPELLVLDEPTSGLDTMVRREFLESMVDLTAAGQTVFLSSHQIPEVERVADIVAIMRDGKLLLVQRLDELKESCREVIVTYDGEVVSGLLPGQVIHTQVRGRQSTSLVRGCDEEELYRLQDRPEVRAVDSKRASLEEIFVAYMRADVHRPQTEAPEARQWIEQ